MADLTRTQPEIVRMLRKVGLGPRPAKIGSAIALCEAPGPKRDGKPTSNFGLVGDLDLQTAVWGPSIGGFQVRSLKAEKGDGTYRDEDWLRIPRNNADAARIIYLQRGWGAWSTYTSGMYKAYLQDIFPPPTGTYVVQAGDTLSSIGSKIGMAWQELARLNNLHEPYNIYIGQLLLTKEVP